MTGKIENLIDELPQASNRRAEEIASILEGVLSDIECRLPTEDDTNSAYECENIPKARELLVLVRAWIKSDGELKTGNMAREAWDSGIKVIHTLSKELKTTFNQI